MNVNTQNTQPPLSDAPAWSGLNVCGLLAEYGPNLMQLNTSLTLAEIHQFVDYRVEAEISPKADGPIADILRSVQRPATKERQSNIGTYQEKYLLKPKPLHESTEQGFMPSITLLCNRPLVVRAVPGVLMQMGLSFVMAEKENEDTMVIPSDGVGRLTGLENRENLYAKANADSETRRLRAALSRLRVPTLILFPRAGELTELHMQQAVYDMNVLATPLTSTMALNRDNRSPYNAVVKTMLAEEQANLKRFNLDLASLVRFTKVALEGLKAAEKAGAAQGSTDVDIPQAAAHLTYFWSLFTASMAPGTLSVEGNMATGASGITGLALVAHELFYGRASGWSPAEKESAIKKLGALDWLRMTVTPDGAVLTPTWAELGLIRLKPDGVTAVMGGAGANNSRIMTAYLLRVIGLEKPAGGHAASTPARREEREESLPSIPPVPSGESAGIPPVPSDESAGIPLQ
jgi:hypothetical protein